MGSERLPALLKICLFGCLACVGAFVVCHLFKRPKYFSALHSVVIVCAGDIRLLFKLLFKFGNVLKHTKSRGSLACNQNIKENISAALEVFLCFEIKRNEATYMERDPSRKLPRNTRVIFAEELGTMCKNNLSKITLVKGPTWGIRSLTLIISWFEIQFCFSSLHLPFNFSGGSYSGVSECKKTPI